MAILYTEREIANTLRDLRIKPLSGLITTKEAASILTWRAKAEQGVEHVYPESAVRRHVERENLKIAKRGNGNLYRVEDVFDLPLVPNRGLSQKKEIEAVA